MYATQNLRTFGKHIEVWEDIKKLIRDIKTLDIRPQT